MKHSITLDISKGLLVLVMLIHHAWSAIYLPGGIDTLRSIVSFVSSAFMLYSGYLFGLILFVRYVDNKNDRLKRDLIRAIRLLFIFILCNTVLYFLNYNNLQQGSSFIQWLFDCLGPTPSNFAVFSLLNAFSYFFFGCSILLYISVKLFSAYSELWMRILTVVIMILAVFWLYSYYGFGVGNLFSSATIYGFIGVVLGLIAEVLLPLYFILFRKIGWFFLVLYLSLSLLAFIGLFSPYQHYTVFVFIGSLAIWKYSDILFHQQNHGWFVSLLRYIGRYTLLAYMVQVLIGRVIDMFLLHFLYDNFVNPWLVFSLSLLIMGGGMIFLLIFVTYLRGRFEFFERSYRVVFG